MNVYKGIAKLIPFRTLCVLFMILNNSGLAFHASRQSAGFYCDDESIRRSYHGDSINIYMLLFVLLGVFGFIVKQCACMLEEDMKVKAHLKDYLSGVLYVMTFTELLKSLFTELRPHFFYTCMPDMSQIDCSKGLVTSFNCTGTGPRWLVERDIYKSFPSGHSSTSVFAFVFITLLLHTKRKPREENERVWWLSFVPLLFFTWAAVCCVSRILDNRHFWWDVLSGVFIGIVGGYIMAKFSIRRSYSQCKTA